MTNCKLLRKNLQKILKLSWKKKEVSNPIADIPNRYINELCPLFALAMLVLRIRNASRFSKASLLCEIFFGLSWSKLSNDTIGEQYSVDSEDQVCYKQICIVWLEVSTWAKTTWCPKLNRSPRCDKIWLLAVRMHGRYVFSISECERGEKERRSMTSPKILNGIKFLHLMIISSVLCRKSKIAKAFCFSIDSGSGRIVFLFQQQRFINHNNEFTGNLICIFFAYLQKYLRFILAIFFYYSSTARILFVPQSQVNT